MRSNTTGLLSLNKSRSRAGYFAFGFGLTALCGWLLANWYSLANEWLGLGVIYDTRPTWLRALMGALAWLPWLALGALVFIRATRGPIVRPLAYAAGAVSVYALLLSQVLLGPVVSARMHRRAFDPEGWMRNDRTDAMWPTRLAMVDNLLATQQLVGLTRDSVVRLLGPRDSTEYFREWDFVYWLGPERGLIRMDSEWLVLRLGDDGRVSHAQIVRD